MTSEYETGVSSHVLGDRYGLSPNAVLKLIRGEGVRVMQGKVTPEMAREMAVLRDQGLTYQTIGERFGVSRTAVSRHLAG